MHPQTTRSVTPLEGVTQDLSKLKKVGTDLHISSHPCHGDLITITKHHYSKELMNNLNTLVFLDTHKLMETKLSCDPSGCVEVRLASKVSKVHHLLRTHRLLL